MAMLLKEVEGEWRALNGAERTFFISIVKLIAGGPNEKH